MSEATHCYIGIKPDCGCIRFVTTDMPEYAKENAKSIAACIKGGYTVERITVEEFKTGTRKFGCKEIAGCKHAKVAA